MGSNRSDIQASGLLVLLVIGGSMTKTKELIWTRQRVEDFEKWILANYNLEEIAKEMDMTINQITGYYRRVNAGKMESEWLTNSAIKKYNKERHKSSPDEVLGQRLQKGGYI